MYEKVCRGAVFRGNGVYYHRALSLYFSNFCVCCWNSVNHVFVHLGKLSNLIAVLIFSRNYWQCHFRLASATENRSWTKLQECDYLSSWSSFIDGAVKCCGELWKPLKFLLKKYLIKLPDSKSWFCTG